MKLCAPLAKLRGLVDTRVAAARERSARVMVYSLVIAQATRFVLIASPSRRT